MHAYLGLVQAELFSDQTLEEDHNITLFVQVGLSKCTPGFGFLPPRAVDEIGLTPFIYFNFFGHVWAEEYFY
jgi:hypothetical protein